MGWKKKGFACRFFFSDEDFFQFFYRFVFEEKSFHLFYFLKRCFKFGFTLNFLNESWTVFHANNLPQNLFHHNCQTNFELKWTIQNDKTPHISLNNLWNNENACQNYLKPFSAAKFAFPTNLFYAMVKFRWWRNKNWKKHKGKANELFV